MKIAILTMGSRGDIEPFVALGKGLKNAGHEVRVATHGNFRSMVEDRGLEYRPVEGNPQVILEEELGKRWIETGERMSPYTFMKRMMDAATPLIRQAMDDYLEACRGTDLILTSVLSGVASLCISEKLGIRTVGAYLQHVHPTSIYPSATAAPKPRLGKIYNRLTYVLSAFFYWQLLRPHVNKWRREVLGLPPYSFGGPLNEKESNKHQFLCGVSPAVLPKAPEWGDNIHITGYWFLDKTDGWIPPDDLMEFLDKGKPPVFVGFSSMTNREPEKITRLIIDALHKSGQRGIIATGWGGLSEIDLPSEIFIIKSAPFDWLFPRMAAVVHHGGAGTTATGIRAGVPSIVVPFFADQFFWGWRVSELGVGPKSIPRKKLTSDRLAAAITKAVRDTSIRERAARFGEILRAEDGVRNAVNVVNEIFDLPK